MKVERLIEIETTDIQIGDRIRIDHYTATCHTVTPKGALFLLDQYIYERGDLRNALQSEEVLNIFKDIREYMVSFENGDLLRIPYYGEMFDNNDRDDFVKSDSNEQWPLMTDAHNRTASRCGDPEWGWLANTFRDTSTNFCCVSTHGNANYWNASASIGVRPAFLIARESILD